METLEYSIMSNTECDDMKETWEYIDGYNNMRVVVTYNPSSPNPKRCVKYFSLSTKEERKTNCENTK